MPRAVSGATRLACGLAAGFFLAVASTRADAGPVKHWAAFPLGEVRAIPLRGDVGVEPQLAVVQGRDGYVYVRGQFGLYRVVNAEGRTERVADTSDCGNWSEAHGADARSRVPVALCSRASHLIVAAAAWHRHIVTPVPGWPDDFTDEPYGRYDTHYLTDVVPDGERGYRFAYSKAHGIGRVWPSGRTSLRHVGGRGRWTGFVTAGGLDYVASDDCRVGRVAGERIVDVREFGCDDRWPSLRIRAGADGALWTMSGNTGIVERRGATRRRWKLGFAPSDAAVSQDGTAYVIGTDRIDQRRPRSRYRTRIAIIRRCVVREAVVPMRSASGVYVDGRDRLWIVDASIHAAAVVVPRGAWR